MKKIFLLFLLVSTSLFAQKVEQGVLLGAGIGFPMQDNQNLNWETNDYAYGHNLKGNGMLGYRFRFLPEQKSFYDLDLALGFQGMNVDRYQPFYNPGSNTNGEYILNDGKNFGEFVMPISVAASWNYHLTDKFHFGLGAAPTLYVQPQVVFDLGILAKVGYRFSRHFELGLSYQYGCLDIMKHFNDGPALGRKGHLSDLMVSAYIPLFSK